MRKAAQTVYDTDKYNRRGEFGELILHALLRETRKTEPAISKIFFKDAINNTVKGFDAVHALDTPNGLELWLGEVKFYKDINRAITDVTAELEAHFQDDYLKKEFMLIANKLDSTWSGTEKLRKLLHPNTSLDKAVSAIVVPVLLTYESAATKSFTKDCKEYREKLLTELLASHTKFKTKNTIKKVRVELFLFPMADKEVLLNQLQKRLEAAQAL